MKKRKYGKKRIFFISAFIIFLLITLINSIAKDLPVILENKSKIVSLNNKYNELLSEEEKLVSEVTRLQDDDYIARYAKEKYLYSGPGETIIRIDDYN